MFAILPQQLGPSSSNFNNFREKKQVILGSNVRAQNTKKKQFNEQTPDLATLAPSTNLIGYAAPPPRFTFNQA